MCPSLSSKGSQSPLSPSIPPATRPEGRDRDSTVPCLVRYVTVSPTTRKEGEKASLSGREKWKLEGSGASG